MQKLYPEYDQPRSSIRPFDLSDDERQMIHIQLDHERDDPPSDQPEGRYRSPSQSSTEDNFVDSYSGHIAFRIIRGSVARCEGIYPQSVR
eukprot:g67845.t1